MTNLHAAALETLLKQKGLTIAKFGKEWRINGQHPTIFVYYSPATGVVRRGGSRAATHGDGAVRGSAQTIADLLEGMVK